jgi:dihydrofolate synthase/folylpolyglutamate synthase
MDGQPCSGEELAEAIEQVRPAVEAMDREAVNGTEAVNGAGLITEAEEGTGPVCRNDAESVSQKLDLSRLPPEGPTYFEILTAAALWHFRRCKADAVVLEVGLGGRLDSTNVCTPCLSIITSISFDHVRQLGPTLADIAGEKAGIIKPGVPVISGVRSEEPREVVRRIAQENGCRLVELGVDFDFTYHPPQHLEQAASLGRVDYSSRSATPVLEHRAELSAHCSPRSEAPALERQAGVPKLELGNPMGRSDLGNQTCGLSDVAIGLLGRHQGANAALTLAAVDELRHGGWTIPEAAVRRGLAELTWPARIEVVARRPAVVLDAAHNAASIAALIEVLAESFSVRRRILVFATTQDKDIDGMLRHLTGRFHDVIFTRYLNNPRGVPPEDLPKKVGSELFSSPLRASTEGWSGDATGDCHIRVAATPAEAWDAVRRLATPDDLVCITGSFFFAAEMREQITLRPGG